MPCKASIRQIGDVSIVDLSGRITLGDGAGIVRETVKDILKGGQKKLLLNLGDVSYIDSSGLGELVSAYATGASQGAQIKLLNAQKRVHDLIQLTKLYTVFESFTSETDALRSFEAKAASV
jgi:anti-sigma B factor antagonist